MALKLTWLATRFTGFSRRLGGWFGARLWFTPWRVPRSERALAREATWLRGTHRFFIETTNHRLAATALGSGPVVLIAHGWGERAATMGGLLHPLADAGFRAVAIDLPGHGDTGSGQTDAVIASSALREAASALGAEFVIGHSMGGHATVVALRDGLRVRGAVLLSPAVRLEHSLTFFSKSFKLPEKSAQGLSDNIERRYGRSVWSDFAADRIAQKLSIPALIVHDMEDPQVPVTDAVMLTNAWQGARFHRTRGLGHMKVLRDPEVISSVAGFLSELSEKELVAVGS